MLLNWTYFHSVDDEFDDFVLNEEINIIPPRTSAEPPPPPQETPTETPPVPTLDPIATQEVIKPTEKPVEKIEQTKPTVPQEVTSNSSTNADSKSTDLNAKNNTNNALGEEPVLMRAEQMPRFPGCESFPEDEKIKQACSKEKLKEYITKNLNYPAEARVNKIEGVVYVKFVVDKDGSVSNVSVINDPGSGLGEASKKLVESMNKMPKKWQPALQNNQPVRVYFTLPVSFKLNKTGGMIK